MSGLKYTTQLLYHSLMHIQMDTWQNFYNAVDILSVNAIFKLRKYLKT